jgi:sulfotransferase
MVKKFNFISGLPRSGTTLLSSILKQNPRFTAGISDPLEMFTNSIIKDTNTAVGMGSAVDIDKRRSLIKALFESFYEDGNDVCFNTNRGWASETALLKDLFPAFKMIVCLREIPWILDSFERLNSKNPYTVKPLYSHQQLANVYDRTHMLMGNIQGAPGYVAGPLMNTKASMFSAEKSQLLYVEYDTLAKHPESAMRQIYAFLEEPWFAHNFRDVENSYDEFDIEAKIEGLHTVRRTVDYVQRATVLPADLWNQYSPNSFWLQGFDHVKRELNWVSSQTKHSSSTKQL